MGCKASKEGAVAVQRPTDGKADGKAAKKKKKNHGDHVRVDDLTNASDSDWGDLIDDIGTAEPLGNAKRRRLSISTVHGPMEIQEASGAVAERRVTQAPHENKRRGSLQRATSMRIIPGMAGQRGKIKVTEHAKLLHNGRAEAEIEDARQFKELFPDSTLFGVFGELVDESQGGFDNKSHAHIGAMPKGMLLQDIGVGYACRKGLKPESPNQDDFFVLRVDDWSMYGVFDGHGPYGHAVSAFIHRTLPYLICSDPEFMTDLHGVLRRAFHTVNHLCALASEKIENKYPQEDERYWDCMLSGTTCTVMVAKENEITVAHVGDSRAIAGSMQNGKFIVADLTDDHKPQDKLERKRIDASGGEVKKLEGDIPFRVFCKDKHYPGLAMSRALGDALAQSIGVSCDPIITTYPRTNDDLFVVLASDGVWEFMESQEVGEVVYKAGLTGCQKSADACSIESWKRWLQEEGNVVDDITCLVVWNEKHIKVPS